MMKVAVSGVGGGVGQSIMKALTIGSLPVEVYPVDITPFSAGLYRGVQGTVLPPPETPEGLVTWASWLQAKGIDALIPGSDHDALPLASVRDEWATKGICRILVSCLDLVQTCRDKAMTYQRLQALGLPVPKSVWDLSLSDALSWARSQGFPLVVKPRDGFASRGVHVVRDEEEFSFFFRRTAKPLVQEYLSLSGEVEEFTCAVFVDCEGVPVGTFIARRDLSAGTTYRAEIGFWQEIHDLLVRIGAALRPRGPLNVQLRLTERGPVPFELNIRCSGTAAIRAHFGYNEPEMLLRHFVLGEQLVAPKPRRGFVFRYWNEIFLEDVSRERLIADPGSLHGSVRAWP